MTSVEYWNSLPFDHLISWSLFRGLKFEAFITNVNNSIFEKRKIQTQTRWFQKNKLEAEIALLENSKNVYGTTVLDDDLNLHGSAEKIKHVDKTDQDITILKSILTTPYKDGARTLCIPIYRDAIIFYDSSGIIVSSLNICFECWKIADGNSNPIEVYGEKVFPMLKNLLTKWGHNI